MSDGGEDVSRATASLQLESYLAHAEVTGCIVWFVQGRNRRSEWSRRAVATGKELNEPATVIPVEGANEVHLSTGNSALVHVGTSLLNQRKGNPTPKGAATTRPTRHTKKKKNKIK